MKMMLPGTSTCTVRYAANEDDVAKGLYRYCKNLDNSDIWKIAPIEPSYESMAFFVLHKHILETRMRSQSVGLDVWFLVRPFIYFHTSCVRTAKALARLRRCAGSPEPLLVTYVISTIISWDGWIILIFEQYGCTIQYVICPKYADVRQTV